MMLTLEGQATLDLVGQQHNVAVLGFPIYDSMINFSREGAGHIVNRKGELVQTAIKPGARVHVYFVDTGSSRVIDHVVVD
jgi:hypothetical protein